MIRRYLRLHHPNCYLKARGGEDTLEVWFGDVMKDEPSQIKVLNFLIYHADESPVVVERIEKEVK